MIVSGCWMMSDTFAAYHLRLSTAVFAHWLLCSKSPRTSMATLFWLGTLVWLQLKQFYLLKPMPLKNNQVKLRHRWMVRWNFTRWEVWILLLNANWFLGTAGRRSGRISPRNFKMVLPCQGLETSWVGHSFSRRAAVYSSDLGTGHRRGVVNQDHSFWCAMPARACV